MPVPMLASHSSQSLYPSSSCANTPQLFPVCRCPCWRRPSRKAFALRRFTPTRPGFFRFAGAHVGVDLPAKPLFFVELRQHAPAFSGLPVPMLASTFPQSLCSSLSHANTVRLFPTCRRQCWRRPSRKAFALRRFTPTRLGFFRFTCAHVGVDSPQSLCPSSSHANTPRLFPICRHLCWRRPLRKALILRRTAPTRPDFFQSAGVFVGVALPAKPLPFVESRQHAPAFSGLPVPMLASTFPQSLCSSSVHANTPRLFPVCRRLCWRRPSRKAFALRRVTPTRPGFSRPAGAHVGVALPAKPLPFVESRQHAPAFSGLPVPMLASTFPQSLCSSLSHANTVRLFPTCRRQCWRRPSRKAFALRRFTPTRPGFSRLADANVGVALIAKPLSFVEPRQHPKV